MNVHSEENSSSATELSLILGTCEQEVAFTSTCCTIEPEHPSPDTLASPDNPYVCSADLYHQLMRYDGLDINQITIGSACGFMMRNQYEYDGLHRLTKTNNVFFGADPYPDAFSNTYSYDRAGNIQQLMRRGIIDMGPGNVPQSDTIDLLDYTYADIDGVSSILASVDDGASNPLAQPLGVASPINTYGYDGNGNMTIGGPVNALYNIMNLPTQLITSAGERHFAYVYGGGKYSARIEADSALSETRLYLGGMEFKDGEPENYNFGDGRIVYSDTVPPRPQFRLHDHLGNTVVFFEDKNLDGCITTEADTSGLALEILQRLWYYPFGMAMEGLSTWDTEPGQWYRYNGKERDTLSGWTEYGARWYIDGIGRFTGVDPIADQFPHVSVFNYAENEPVGHIDLHGLQQAIFVTQTSKNSNGHNYVVATYDRTRPDAKNHDHIFSLYSNTEKYGTRGTLEVVHNLDNGRIVENFTLTPQEQRANKADASNHVGGGIEQSSEDGGGLEKRFSKKAEVGPNIDLMLATMGVAKGASEVWTKAPTVLDLLQYANNAAQTGTSLQYNIHKDREGKENASQSPSLFYCSGCEKMRDSAHLDKIHGPGTYNKKVEEKNKEK